MTSGTTADIFQALLVLEMLRVAQVQAILNLDGDATMSISDQGAMMISVDSGMTKYDYILPAQSK